jgi:DNA repair protein RadC
MTYPIAEIPRHTRPRERLLEHGAEVLTDAELLALIIGTGAAGKNAIHLAEELLAGGVANLYERDHESLERVRGIGPAKAARIAALLEMSRRLAKPMETKRRFDPAVFGEQLITGYARQRQERVGAALLNARHCVTKQREIFIGTLDRALASPRDIIRFALMERATAVVVFHNHPSGDPTPSGSDVSFTRQLKQSLEMVDLELVDHFVIGANRYSSMKERGDM